MSLVTKHRSPKPETRLRDLFGWDRDETLDVWFSAIHARDRRDALVRLPLPCRVCVTGVSLVSMLESLYMCSPHTLPAVAVHSQVLGWRVHCSTSCLMEMNPWRLVNYLVRIFSYRLSSVLSGLYNRPTWIIFLFTRIRGNCGMQPCQWTTVAIIQNDYSCKSDYAMFKHIKVHYITYDVVGS